MSKIPLWLAGAVSVLLSTAQAVLALLVPLGVLKPEFLIGTPNPPTATVVVAVTLSVLFSGSVGVFSAMRAGFLTMRGRDAVITGVLWTACVLYTGNVLFSLAVVSSLGGVVSLLVSLLGAIACGRLASQRRSPKQRPARPPAA